MSKSSKKRRSSTGTGEDFEEPGQSRKTLAIAAVVIAILIIAGFWLMSTGALFGGDPIVGTWTDQNKYWAYAYYSNGSMLELGHYTHKTGDISTHVPVYMAGNWTNIGNSQYSITIGEGQNSTTFTTVMNGKNMSVINTSDSGTHKISNLADVDLVDFNYIP